MEREILQYIPQRDPIVMVSEIVQATEKDVNTRLFISDDNVFVQNGFLQEPGIIENIAQTAAAMTGYNAIKNKQEVKRGFIGSVNNLKISSLPKVGEHIETHVFVEAEVMNVHIIQGVVVQNGETLAECSMKIFLEE